MKYITELMIRKYNIIKTGYDFMGYRFNEKKSLSYHHLIVPKKRGGKETPANGAILVRDSAHDYLHIIEHVNRKYYLWINEQMKEENDKGFLDMENIKNIDEILCEFEKKYYDETLKNGTYIVQDVYIRRLLREQALYKGEKMW
jgi:hypothetical protein